MYNIIKLRERGKQVKWCYWKSRKALVYPQYPIIKKMKGSGTNEKKNRKENKKNITKNQLYIVIYNFRMSIH